MYYCINFNFYVFRNRTMNKTGEKRWKEEKIKQMNLTLLVLLVQEWGDTILLMICSSGTICLSYSANLMTFLKNWLTAVEE